MRKRVVITGVGVVSSLGIGTDAFWQGLCEGRCGIRPIETIGVDGLKIAIAAEVPDYIPGEYFDHKRLKTLDRCSQFALLAAREAMADSGLDISQQQTDRTATIVGSAIGGNTTVDDGYKKLYGDGNPRVNPMTIPRVMISAPPSQISMELGLRGPTFAVSSACSSSNHAIGEAFRMLQHGYADIAVTGGCEASISFGMMKSWQALRVISADTCRPFSLDRSGMVIGEGAGMLVLETLDHARARGAEIYAELAGFGMSADAEHLIMPSKKGACRAMQAALDDAKMAASDIDYINAHGTGTPVNDVSETAAIHDVFSEHARELLVSSTKSMHGHALGAAGSLEGIATVLALRHGILPPTVNFTQADPDCDLDYIVNTAREKKIDMAISNSFAFGGLNSVLAFRA
ncbi:MAG: beta-ketoacyl-ACP synthase II [Mariprofundus sp.]|nr:beta-ketoacyl-ACP synthase II [Mariprofundus sp.]